MIEDLLIDFDEMGFMPTTTCEYPNEYALEWKQKLIAEIELIKDEARKETAKEILLLLGKGYDETKMTEFKNLPWYKLFCRELNNKYGVEVEE